MQEAVRDDIDRGMQLREGEVTKIAGGLDVLANRELFTEYLEYRAASTRPTTSCRRSSRSPSSTRPGWSATSSLEEILNYSTLLAAAGNETTAKLIGWTGYLPGTPPGRADDPGGRPGIDPRGHRGDPALRSPLARPGLLHVAQPTELHGTTVPEGSVILLLTAAANRDDRKFEDADRFDVRRQIDHHVSVRVRAPLLPGSGPGATRGHRRPPGGAQAFSPLGGRSGKRGTGAHVDSARLAQPAGHLLTRTGNRDGGVPAGALSAQEPRRRGEASPPGRPGKAVRSTYQPARGGQDPIVG